MDGGATRRAGRSKSSEGTYPAANIRATSSSALLDPGPRMRLQYIRTSSPMCAPGGAVGWEGSALPVEAGGDEAVGMVNTHSPHFLERSERGDASEPVNSDVGTVASTMKQTDNVMLR